MPRPVLAGSRPGGALGTAVLLLVTSTLLLACGAAPDRAPTPADFARVAQSDSFYLIRLRNEQTMEDAAEAFLGTRDAAWQLAEVNALRSPGAGDLLAVPRHPLNPTGVYPDGYRSLPILCYHQFTAGEPPAHKLELRAEDFEAQLRFLRDNGYRTLALSEVQEILRLKRPMPERAVVLTIDDGYASVYDVAWPLLKAYGMKATLFIYTDFVGAGAALSWEQLREMRDSGLIEVESHGKSHASLARLPDDEDESSYRLRLARELSGSEAAFMANLGKAPDYLSYPYGNSSRTIANMLRDNGYGLAATVTRGRNSSFVDPFLLHRTMIYDGQTLAEFEKFLSNFSSRPGPR